MYTRKKLTLAERVSIPVGSVVELPVEEYVNVGNIICKEANNPLSDGYATLHIRKCLAKDGLIQLVSTPFPYEYEGTPLIVVKNDSVAPIELRKGDEIGELWVMYG